MSSKYNVNSELQMSMLKDMLNDAIMICDYSNEYEIIYGTPKDLSHASVLSMYVLRSGKDEQCSISLTKLDDVPALCIMTPFIKSIFVLNDVNALVLAYVIRNVTKSIDNFDKSLSFFNLFFNTHAEFANDEFLNVIINNAFDEYSSTTFVFPNNVRDELKVKTQQKSIA